MLTIVASMERELSGVRRGLKPGQGHELRVVGIGPDRAGEAMRQIFSADAGTRPRGPVLMLGVAGALSPLLKAGDVILASSYLRLSNPACSSGATHLESLAPDPRLSRLADRAAAQAGLPVNRGPSLTVDSVVRLAEEKARLHRDFSATSVNMEDFAVASIARRYCVPFLSARVVLDTCEQPLPAYLASLSGPLSRSVMAVAAKPWRITELAALSARMRRAQSVLARFAQAFVHEFEAAGTAATQIRAGMNEPGMSGSRFSGQTLDMVSSEVIRS